MLRSISTHFTHRGQLLTPLQLTSTLGKVDIEATYTGPTGGASLAGALRLGMSRALTSFVDKNVREQLRLGQLQCTSADLLSSRSCFLFHIAKFVKEHICKPLLHLHRLLFFVAGMLTTDPRRKERQKPGQARARKKFTWYVVSAALLLLVRQESAISSVLGSMDIFNRVMEKRVVGKNQDFMLMNWYIQTMWLAVVGTSTNQIVTVDCQLMGLWGVLTWGLPR